MQKKLLRSNWKNCVFSLGVLSILTASNVFGQAFQKVLFVGNSISSHGPSPTVGWYGDWGMAASSPDKDYIHRVMTKIRSKVPDASYQLLWGVPFEQNWNAYDYSVLNDYKNFGADLIIMRIGENVKDEDVESGQLRQSYLRLLDGIANPNSKIILTNCFWQNHERFNAMIQSIAVERNLPIVHLTDLSENPANMAYGLFDNPGVAAHPGDKGMEEIANRILASLGSDPNPTRAFSRYLSFGIMNVESGDYYLPVMEKAAAAGVNAFLLNVNWDHVIPTRGATPDWSQLDKQADLAERLGCKLILRVWLARHDDGDGGWWPENARPTSGEGIRHRLVNGFSYSASDAVEEANAFLRSVMEHFRPRQQAGQIVTVTAVTNNASEIGYSVDAYNPATGKNELQSFDFSFYSKIAFREWAEMKYKTVSNLNKAWNSDYSRFSEIYPPYTKGDVWSAYYSNIGMDWYLFRHFAMKNTIKKFRSTIKEVDPSYQFYLDMGSCYDGLTNLRGTFGFKDLSEEADGMKVNDGPSYPHRFAMDLLRTNLPGKMIGNEFEFISPETASQWPQQVNQSFEHGANWVNIFGFDNGSRYPYVENLIKETAAKWLKVPVPDIQPTQTVTYTLSEAIRMGTGRAQGQWREEYAKTYTPIKVILVEDALSEKTQENQPPVVRVPLFDQYAKVDKDFQFHIPDETFLDPDGYIAGISVSGLPNGLVLSERSVLGKALLIGEYTITVTARDNAGAEVATQFKLNVSNGDSNLPPTVSRGIADQLGKVGEAFRYEVSKETFTDADGSIAGVSFSGLPSGLTAAGWVVSGVPAAAGVYTVTVTASDNAGAKVSTQFKLMVGGADSGGNQYPEVRKSIADQSGTVGVAFAYEISKETFVDPDGPIIDITVTGLPAGVSQSGWVVSGVPATAGVYTVTVTARDNRDLKVATQFKLTVTSAGPGGNQPPVVSRSIPDQSGTVGVAFRYEVSKETFTDPDGSIVGVSFTGLPAGLTATGWVVSGVPSAAGVYTVKVTASDNAGAQMPTSFKLRIEAVQIENRVSLFTAGNFITRRFILDIFDGDTLSGEQMKQSVNILVSPTTGTVGSYSFVLLGPVSTISEDSSTPYGVFGDNGGNVLSPGNYTLTLKSYASAGLQGALLNEQVVHFVVLEKAAQQNLSPVLTKVPGTLYAKVGVPYEHRLSDSTFVDPDGFLTTFTLTALPPGLIGDGTLIRGTPTQAAEFTVNVRVTDNGGGVGETTFRFIVSNGETNVPPVVSRSIADQSGTVGAAFRYEVSKETFTDVDGSIVGVSFTGLPSGLTATGWVVSGVPSTAGVYTVSVTASDNAGGQTATKFKLTVSSEGPGENQPPVVSRSIPDQSGTVGEAFAYEISKETFTDADGSIAGVSFSGLPSGLTAAGWVVSGIPAAAGVYTVSVTASDNAGAQVSTPFKLTVGGADSGGNQYPEVRKSIADQSGTVGVAFAYEISKETFVDPDGPIIDITVTGPCQRA